MKKIHFIGVGGVSMSSLIRFFNKKDYDVSGSDINYSETLIRLNEEGIRVWSGFEPSLIGNPDLVIYSSAIPLTNPELTYLRANGIKCMERNTFLTYLSRMFSYTVAIAGTHGKTTVTSMCAEIMKTANLSFYAHIGGESKTLGSFYYCGDTYLLMEACEYRRSMLNVSPSVGIVLNAEVDHPDTYRDKSDVFDAFDDFLSSSKLSIVNGDSEYYRLRQAHSNLITFGFSPECTYRGVNIKQYENGCFGCCVLYKGLPFMEFKLNIPGRCNLLDALASVAVCSTIKIENNHIINGLSSFKGVARRFDYRGDFFSSKIIIDYAHHPTEITEAINTAKCFNIKNLTIVFQPHTFSRTARLKKEFVSALSQCDKLIILKEYPARETPADGMSALALFRECKNKEKYYTENIIDCGAMLYKITNKKSLDEHNQNEPFDMILILGAGDIVELTKLLIY